MKRIVWSAVVLVFGLAACSSPDLASSPSLAAQFGTAEDEIGVDVATISTGRVYSLSRQILPYYELQSNGASVQIGETSKVILRRFDGLGKQIWVREVASGLCRYEYGDQCFAVYPKRVITDTSGAVNVVYEDIYTDYVDVNGQSLRLDTYSATGSYINYANLSYADDVSGNVSINPAKQVFSIITARNFNYDTGEYEGSDLVSGYASDGRISWQRTSTVGTPVDIIATNTSVYVAGSKGLARYTTSGNLVWTKALGPLENVVVSGSNIYTRYRLDIRKFDANGTQLWLKKQSGLSSMVMQDMSGDTSGNVYLAGKYAASSSNRNPFVRKLNSSGSTLWTKTYGTTAYDDALGVATITGSEIYVTGETQGSLSHTNIGGRDGYLRKLNSSGNLVWSK